MGAQDGFTEAKAVYTQNNNLKMSNTFGLFGFGFAEIWELCV